MEVIDIGVQDLDTSSVSLNKEVNFNIADPEPSPKNSVNIGPGIELLMNDKNISQNHSSTIEMDDLDKLEKELNEASGVNVGNDHQKEESNSNGFYDFLGLGKKQEPVMREDNNDSKLGAATIESQSNNKTWDGFTKINDVPKTPTGPRLNEREKRRKKRAMIKKMEEWYDKGHIKHMSSFTMDSDFDEVEDEYETFLEEKRKKDSIKLQGWWFTTLVNSLEYANALFDPFALNLDGWGEQINEDIDSYEEIFGELHEKYKGGKMAPEISLLLRLAFSGAVLNITNKALSTATPGFNDVIKQSPELMKMFSNATVNTMNNNNPGMGMDFINEMMNPENKPDTSFGPPPKPMETKNHPPPRKRPNMEFTNDIPNRPDISMARGAMFREDGIDISESSERINEQRRTPISSDNQQQSRPEMKGPQNIDLNGLLSGLKPKEVNIHTASKDNESIVSISSLKEGEANVMPKKSRPRKQKSDRNVVSLDI